jgi:hypothetical protein
MVFKDSELVMYKKDGKIYGGGFTVNSIMMQHGISPITRVNVGGGGGSKKGGGTGGAINDSFANLAIPAGLYYFDTGLVGQSGGGNQFVKEEGHVSDAMYSTLMDLAGNINNEYVGGADEDDEDDNDSDSDLDEVEINNASPSSGGKKHKKTKKQRLAQKGRKTRKH